MVYITLSFGCGVSIAQSSWSKSGSKEISVNESRINAQEKMFWKINTNDYIGTYFAMLKLKFFLILKQIWRKYSAILDCQPFE